MVKQKIQAADGTNKRNPHSSTPRTGYRKPRSVPAERQKNMGSRRYGKYAMR